MGHLAPRGPPSPRRVAEQRPLEEGQLAYAVLDTSHLLPLMDQLREELVVKGRLEEAEEDFALLERTEAARPRAYDPEAFWRIHGVKGLDAGAQRVLAELHAERERVAAERDLSPHRIAPDRVLVELARRRPRRASASAVTSL